MPKKVIGYEDIKNGGDHGTALPIFLLFAAVGIAIIIATLVNYLKDMTTNNLITFLVLTGVFGIPFGVLIGMRNAVRISRKKAMIRNGQVRIYVDVIVEKSHVPDALNAHDPKQYQITARDYSRRTGKNVLLQTRREFDAAREGEPCILCFVPGHKRPFRVFAGGEYTLSDELQGKCVSNIGEILP